MGCEIEWQDIDYANECIHVRRTWIDGQTSEKMKTKQSRSAVPMAAELAQFLRDWRKVTAYGRPTDWVFASAKTHGRTPRVGNVLVADHLRPAAIKAGVVLKPGQRCCRVAVDQRRSDAGTGQGRCPSRGSDQRQASYRSVWPSSQPLLVAGRL
jgi:hypothetical protein